MIVRALDADHDWTYGKGKNNYLQRQDAIAQDIETRLLEFLGDCFFNVVAGIDWFGRLSSKNNQLAIELDVGAVITNTAGVTALVQLSSVYNPVNRQLGITYEVNTIYTGIRSVDTIAASANFIITQDGITLTTEDGNPLTT